MAYRVVCISPTDGSDGEQVASIVARELGFSLVNEQLVARAAQEAGVDPATVADVERRKPALGRLLDRLAEIGPAGAAAFSGFAPMGDEGPGRDALRGLITSVIEETAERGNAVVVAHAASLALAGRADVLRVLVSASRETRARRLADAEGMGEAEAEKLVARGDGNRADYVKRFYGISRELPTHYDVVLNTDRLGIEDAAAVVVRAARSGDRSPERPAAT